MKKKLHLFLFLALFTVTVFGQVPMFFNTNVNGGANTFPFANTGASRRVQWFIPPNSIGAVQAGNNITTVYFQMGGAGTATYPIFNIRLKTGSGTGLTSIGGGPIEPGMILVYSAVNQVITATGGQWIGFTLQTPWLYNPNLPLIVEVEHNSTGGGGPTVNQAFTIPGPGNGRQWGDYNVATLSGVGTQQVNFGIDVLPATPCTAAPIANTVIPSSFTTCPFISNPTMSLASTYSFGGITYQWQSSTVSPVGPFSTINGATLSSQPSGTINTTTWFQVVATCTNPGGGSTTITPTQFFVAGSVVSTVPYFESFEGIQTNDRLPNCSWYAPNLGSTVKTYQQAQNNNRLPRTGTSYGSFTFPSNNNDVYSNGITMSPGITYSAAIWYTTEYFGYNNWTSLSLLVGPNQSPVGMIPVASVSPAISGPYKLLSGTFSIPSGGDYYVCLRATGVNGQAIYLSWDDLSVTIPCDQGGAVNSPTLITSVGAGPFCQNDLISISASGANTYLWNDGSTNSNLGFTAQGNTVVTVAGTNTLTGCTTTATLNLLVNPSPDIIAFASKTQICPGDVAYLTAVGAQNYAWSNGSIGSTASVSPVSNTTYSVIGTNNFGCATTATIGLQMLVKPVIVLSGSSADVCSGQQISFNAAGAVNYIWLSSTSQLQYQGSSISIVLNNSTTFTVTGEAANGCTGSNMINQSVAVCPGFVELALNSSFLQVYPNPSTGLFTLKLSKGTLKEVVVTDLAGRVVQSLKSNSDEMTIDLSGLASGIYYANLMDGSSTQAVKLIKE